MKKEILKKELDKIVDISKRFGAKKVLLFGSCLEDISTVAVFVKTIFLFF